jgi:hypothetical protein
MVQAEVHAVDHRVDRGDRVRARPHDGGVIAHPAHDALRARPQELLERRDE